MHKKTGNILFTTGYGLLFLLLTSKFSFACSVCFYGDPNQSSIIGIRLGILSLLIILLIVMGLFVKFFLNLKKRSQSY